MVSLTEKVFNVASRGGWKFKGGRTKLARFQKESKFDAIPEEVKREVYDFWTTHASLPTGDKKEFVRYCIRKNQYTEHVKHILEKSQMEAFLDFKAQHPNMKIKQKKFKLLKPFFVKVPKDAI